MRKSLKFDRGENSGNEVGTENLLNFSRTKGPVIIYVCVGGGGGFFCFSMKKKKGPPPLSLLVNS